MTSFWISILACKRDLIPHQRGAQTKSFPLGKVRFIQGTECPRWKGEVAGTWKRIAGEFLPSETCFLLTRVAGISISDISFMSSIPLPLSLFRSCMTDHALATVANLDKAWLWSFRSCTEASRRSHDGLSGGPVAYSQTSI